MDVVNVFGPMPTLEMTGIGKTTLEDDLARALAWQAHRLQPDPNVVVGFYYRSDHFRSSRAGCRSRSPASAGNWREEKAPNARDPQLGTRFYQSSAE